MQSFMQFGSWDFWPCIAAICIGTAALSIIPSIASQWRKMRVAEAEAALKSQMIDRGMSVDEIERVLAAGKPSKRSDRFDA